ncbi:hypothetical protein BDW42DRAFT_102639 [Aspergillus taichungensis]|uniref:Secreted protein n=1 Tax=Aspergillus taichungensis TaxID=482145 RepID=A0A2J5HUL8_9EURO|nr:hypothetical protein BDW42DRAFT_102639 [Aspergillus taichungensis]
MTVSSCLPALICSLTIIFLFSSPRTILPHSDRPALDRCTVDPTTRWRDVTKLSRAWRISTEDETSAIKWLR